MIKTVLKYYFVIPCSIMFLLALVSCKHKKKLQQTETPVAINDTLNGKCKLDFKSAKTLSAHVKANEFSYNWVYAKAKVESLVDGKEESFDIKLKIRKDSVIWVKIEVIGGLIDVAAVLITKDSVKLVDYLHKTYFRGDFNYINDILNADLDYDVIQAVLFGNSAEFVDDETKLKPVTDRANCHYLLSTERKRRLKRIQQGGSELKKALQTLTLNPDNYKIIKNEFVDPSINRTFVANYKNFTQKDSVYAPYNVDIDIVAEKKANVKIEYVRIEKNKPQKISLSIPSKYDPIQVQKSQSKGLIILICLFVFSITAFAQTGTKSKKDLENKKKRINEEIAEINSMLSETKANKRSSLGALVNINMKIEKRQDLINTINAEIAELNKDIKVNEKKSEILKSTLEKLKADYARMIVLAERNQDSYSKLMFVFAAADFNQAYSRLKYFQQYSDFRKKQAKDIVETQTLLLANLNELKEQKHEKNVLLGNEEVEKQNLNSEKGEQEQVLTELQQKEKDLKKELEKKKQETIELQLAIKKLIADEIKRKAEEIAKNEANNVAAKKAREERENKKKIKEKAKNPDNKTVAKVKPEAPTMPELTEETEALSNDFANNRGKLPWPVGKGVICEGYGEHEHPAIKGFMMFNNGVEICATQGTQVRAVFDGEVTGIAVSPTGGKLVIIRHGEYLSVYSNLSDVTVKTGQKIALKQPIGTVLHNEDEGKTSMNLQIWKGQKTMDPSGWLFNR